MLYGPVPRAYPKGGSSPVERQLSPNPSEKNENVIAAPRLSFSRLWSTLR